MRLAYTLKGMTTLNSIDSTLYPSRIDIAFKSLWRFIPEPLLHYVRYLPSREYHRFRTFLDFSESFSRDIVKESTEKRDGKDMISVLLRANASENPSNKLTDDELIYQITCANIPSFLNYSKSLLAHVFLAYSTLLFAGHDTTANTLTWFLWEVAKHPESQERIRAEIAGFRERKGEEQPSFVDLDNMAYTQAALKVLPCRFVEPALSDLLSSPA
jgi:cytochrome P450